MSSLQAGEPRAPVSRPRVVLLTGLLAAEVIAVTAFQAPFMTVERFATWDSGAELAIQDLLRRGFRPSVDFGYPYGLLPLLIGRGWYGLTGLSPWSFLAEVTAVMVVSAWGLARFVAYRRVGPAGLALVVLAVPDLLFVNNLTLVQVLEQALLVHALAEQGRGRRDRALALLTACCFVKPSLGYVQGLAVTVAALAACRGSGRSCLSRAFGPALATAAVLAALLAAVFGPGPLARTLFPGTGLAIYRVSRYGFFHGVGREFWDLPGAGLRDYFRYEVGFWVVGSLTLVAGGLGALWRLARGATVGDRATDDEVVATCAAVHLVFVTALFGHRVTWVYSFPMLTVGLATLAGRGPWSRRAFWGLVVLLLVNDRSKAIEVVRRWREESASPVTFGLWADRAHREEWERVRGLTRGGPFVLLTTSEGGALFIPGCAPPVGAYLIPGNMLGVEAGRKAGQVAAASTVVTDHPPDWPGFGIWPELRDALDGCEPVMRGRFLSVYRRARPPARGPRR